MNDELARLFAQVQALEDDIERKLDAHRAQYKYSVDRGKAVFEAEVAQGHRLMRVGLARFLRQAPLRHVLVAPVIYAMVVPFGLLDVTLSVYQWICFSAWGISRVQRKNFIVFDRHRLGYLNAIEKVNCIFCGYSNGVIGYAREIAGRTEQYWCPIRHATQIRGPHAQYRDFLDYGDAKAYRDRLAELRAKLR